MKKAIIYARVSSVTDRQSTKRQVNDLTRYAECAGLNLVSVFEEHLSGAKKNAERPVLLDAINYAKSQKIDVLLTSELSRLGRNAFEVLSTVKEMIDAGINIFFQKEQFMLLDESGKPSIFAPIFISTLSACSQLELESIKFRLFSGRRNYVENGGKLGRKEGSVKTKEQLAREYSKVIKELKRGTSVRRTALLTSVSNSTVQRVKKAFDL